jgi:hypothetical protein
MRSKLELAWWLLSMLFVAVAIFGPDEDRALWWAYAAFWLALSARERA